MYLILFIIAFQYIVLNFADKVQDIDVQYDLYILTYAFVALCSLIGWFKLIDYKNLLLKSIVLFETIFIATEIILFGFSYIGLNKGLSIVRGFSLSAWFYYVIYRNFTKPKMKLNNKDIFAVRTVPDDFQGLFLSLINPYPLAGYGLLYKDNFYHFRHGKLVKSSVKVLTAKKDKFIVIKSKKYDKKIINEIESLVGSKWTLSNNCWTKIRPLIK